MAEQQKARAKGRKIGRNKKHQATLYKSGGRFEKNRKRRMLRHLRANPNDEQNASFYRLEVGKLDAPPTSRGRKLLKRASQKEVA